MAEKGKIKISDAKDLYSILPEELRSEFSIGMHQFIKTDGGGRPEELFGEWDEKRIQDVKESILANGLRFSKHSRLLSTVSFSTDLSSYISGEVTKYGGVIVALPKLLKSENGEKMFIGSPNERSAFNNNWGRREEATSVCDFILPDEGVLNPMFVIGTYSVTDEGIVFTPNPNHIAYNNAIVPEQFFNEALERLENGVENSIPKEWNAIMQETLAQQQMYDKYIGKVDSSMRLENRLDLAYMKNLKDYTDIVRAEIKTQIEDMRYLEMTDSEIKESIIEYLGIAEIERLGTFYNEIQSMIEQELAVNSKQPEQQPDTEETIHTQSGIAQEKVGKIRMAIEEMRAAGLDDELITTYMIKGAKGRLGSVEQLGIIGQIKGKYGINEILEEDFFAHNQSQSEEMRQVINGIIQPLSELEKRRMQRKDDIQIEDVPMGDAGISSAPIQEEETEGIEYVQPETPKKEISQETMDRLRVAIQDAKRQGLDGDAIKRYIYKNQAVRGVNSEERKKWIEISSKHGIDEIMWSDYYGDSSYTGHSSEMYDAIDMLTEEEIVSLTELGEKSYKHFGSRIAEKLKEAVNALKSRFFSKDKGKEDMTNGR